MDQEAHDQLQSLEIRLARKAIPCRLLDEALRDFIRHVLAAEAEERTIGVRPSVEGAILLLLDDEDICHKARRTLAWALHDAFDECKTKHLVRLMVMCIPGGDDGGSFDSLDSPELEAVFDRLNGMGARYPKVFSQALLMRIDSSHPS